MSEEESRKILGSYILQEHKKPLGDLDTVVSINNGGSVIYRFLFRQAELSGVITEIGFEDIEFGKLYSILSNKMAKIYASLSIENSGMYCWKR